MTSKAERKRRKRQPKITMPGGDQIDQPLTGRDRANVGQAKPKEDPMQTVLAARRRFMGDKADKVDLRSAMAGDDLGRALLAAHASQDGREMASGVKCDAGQPKEPDAPQGHPHALYGPSALWEAVTHMRRTVAAYDRACGAPSRHPKCLAILTPPDHMEATAESPAFDDRDEATRNRAAVSAYMAMQGWLDHTDRAARTACIRAVVDDTGVSDMPGIILALQCVADGRAGRKITPRIRRRQLPKDTATP